MMPVGLCDVPRVAIYQAGIRDDSAGYLGCGVRFQGTWAVLPTDWAENEDWTEGMIGVGATDAVAWHS